MNGCALSRIAAVAAGVFLAGWTRAGAASRTEVEVEKDSGVTIEVTSPFDNSPPAGCLPVWMMIHNASGAAHTWTFVTDSTVYRGNGPQHTVTEDVRVDNGQTARVPILVPLDATPSGYYYRGHFFQVTGYGVNERQYVLPSVGRQTKSNPTASIGMSEDLATPVWSGLAKWYADSKGQDLMGSAIDVDQLPADWRALAGFDVLWLSDTSYHRLDAGRRVAVGDWIDHGGLLCLCAPTADPSLRSEVGLPPEGDSADVGLGRVQWIAWDGKPLLADKVSDISASPCAVRADPAGALAGAWTMTRDVGAIPINATLLIAFVLAFAVLVGPVNLFVFANAARRHRLFWTTPLISVGASLLLMLFILVKDGFGGYGERALLCLILPEQRKTVLIQEQVARTGVVLAHGFEVAEDILLSPIQIREGPTSSYEQNGRRFSGDWFASRSVQAQRADAVVPSRAEIALANADAARAGAPPVLASSVPAAIRTVRYVDPAGNLWVGDNLRTGERITLHKGGYVGPESFSLHGSAGLDAAVMRLLQQRGGFVAVADEGPFLETLPAIRWTVQHAVFAGLVTGAR